MGRLPRDLKSDTVVLNCDGDVRIADFGACAQLIDEVETRDEAVGSPAWVLREAVRRLPYSFPFESCAICTIALQTAEWEHPHSACSAAVIKCRVATWRAPELKDKCLLSQVCGNFLSRCFCQDASQRWTAHILLQDDFINGACSIKHTREPWSRTACVRREQVCERVGVNE